MKRNLDMNSIKRLYSLQSRRIWRVNKRGESKDTTMGVGGRLEGEGGGQLSITFLSYKHMCAFSFFVLSIFKSMSVIRSLNFFVLFILGCNLQLKIRRKRGPKLLFARFTHLKNKIESGLVSKQNILLLYCKSKTIKFVFLRIVFYSDAYTF